MFPSTTAVVLSYISMIRQLPSTIVNEIFLILFWLMNFYAFLPQGSRLYFYSYNKGYRNYERLPKNCPK